MRSILSISIPANLISVLKEKAKNAHMSTSAYVRWLIMDADEQDAGSALAKELMQAKKDIKNGKYRDITSLDELLQ